MRILRLLTLFIVSASILAPLRAQTLSPSDKTAIKATVNGIGDSLTAMDFDKFATFFTDDADFVNVVGMHWSGKAQIVKAHRIVFTVRYHGFPQHITEQTEAPIAPGVALVTSTIKMDDYTAQDGKRMVNNFSRMTWVLLKQPDGRWLVRSAHNTSIDLVAAPHDPGK